jgi:signal transduction histidine kinase
MPDQKTIEAFSSPAYRAKVQADLGKLAAHLLRNREAILETWRYKAAQDPTTHGVSSMSRAEFHDHIPLSLDALEAKLAAWPGSTQEQVRFEQDTAGEHGAHRWQQGYNLEQMAREWGLLNLVLVESIDAYALLRPQDSPHAFSEARALLAQFINEGILGSVTEFHRLQRTAAEARVLNLESALRELRSMEHQRGQLLREASHDLRGSFSVVQGAASLLDIEELPEEDRAQTMQILQNGVSSVQHMLNDLLDLARLEAGHESRTIQTFNAGDHLRLLCEESRGLAEDRSLFLNVDGPAQMEVEGDAIKVRRIVQNLLLNALKYTHTGGVSVSWDTYKTDRWVVMVADTGPGLQRNQTTPLVQELDHVTQSAREVGASATLPNDSPSQDGSEPGTTPVLVPGGSGSHTPGSSEGEGIGLSIVKRLCELLDASLELDTSSSGSQFRIVFPRHYD